MPLNKHQQDWIVKNRKMGAKKIAEKMNLNRDEVQEFLKQTMQTNAPKYFYLIMLLIPVLFVVLLEVSLRLFNYGNDFRLWVPVTKELVGLNPEIGRKYFSKTKALPESIQDVFYKEKRDSTFRVFVLGGSSAAGYPFMPLGSFSRYIDQRLKLAYPDFNIEVVNVSLTAVNTYTIRDFVPGILEQQPDLILIYAGHNEYYGALGIGSMESLGTSREMVNLILYLDKYKTTQLVRNVIAGTIKLFSEGDKPATGTLMSRMAEDQSIPYLSETYEKGVEQFRENLRDILKMIDEKHIPVIVGNLTSNIEGQEPFISKPTEGYPPAADIFAEAESAMTGAQYKKADSLFRYAKDLDLLRFRAPEDFNTVINQLCKEYEIANVNIDSVFKDLSPHQLIGNNLMTDHLHPTLAGYQVIGRGFYEEMIRRNYLPAGSPQIENSEQDSLTKTNYYYSALDSTIASYKIRVLKNDWPYKKNRDEKISMKELIVPGNKIDSLAYDHVIENSAYFDIQQEAANYYLLKKDFNAYTRQIDILIYQYSYIDKFYKKAANELMTRNRYDSATKYLEAGYKNFSTPYFSKWLGIITLSKGDNHRAITYLEESLSGNTNDEQTLYNLAGAYSQIENYEKALTLVNKALAINPQYQAALNLQNQLQSIVQ